MTSREYRSQVFKVVTADHLVLSAAIENFRRMFMGEHPAVTPQDFANIQRLLAERIVEHFAYEDQTVFPAMLAHCSSPETAKLIAELSQEHVKLAKETERISARLASLNIAKCSGQLWTTTLDFLTVLTQHAAKEEELMWQLEPKRIAHRLTGVNRCRRQTASAAAELVRKPKCRT